MKLLIGAALGVAAIVLIASLALNVYYWDEVGSINSRLEERLAYEFPGRFRPTSSTLRVDTTADYVDFIERDVIRTLEDLYRANSFATSEIDNLRFANRELEQTLTDIRVELTDAQSAGNSSNLLSLLFQLLTGF